MAAIASHGDYCFDKHVGDSLSSDDFPDKVTIHDVRFQMSNEEVESDDFPELFINRLKDEFKGGGTVGPWFSVRTGRFQAYHENRGDMLFSVLLRSFPEEEDNIDSHRWHLWS